MKQGGDIALAVLVLAIIAMLVIPLPTAAIDGLIVLNISVSLLLLLVALYMPSALSLLSFPTLLLLTTLFRLALNVASARLILSQADAGVVIHAFGTFLIRGELFVGLVVFIIVTIVNFLVIAKGASRVSEVAARFVLDALPGKQASIDSDVRAGLMSVEQARGKREEVRKESQLFGAMDGAMKFVQGDAIAGILIIFVNILGGLYMGLSSGMEIGTAAQTYTVLTVGDGLVSQIPALLISICAGIVVTRVSSNEGMTLGKDMFGQLLANPQAVFVTGLLLMVIGLLPGIPFIPFFAVGVIFLSTGWYWRSSNPRTANIVGEDGKLLLPAPNARIALSNTASAGDEKATDRNELPLLWLELGDQIHQVSNGTAYINRFWKETTQAALSDLGIIFPNLQVRVSSSLAPMQMRLVWQQNEICSDQFIPDVISIPIHPSHARALGFVIAGSDTHPLFNTKTTQSVFGPDTRRLTDACDIPWYDSLQILLLKGARYFFDNPEAILSLGYVFKELTRLEKSGVFKAESVGSHFLSPAKLTQILTALVRERVSIYNLGSIFETIAEFCAVHRVTLQDETDVALPVLIDFIRAKHSPAVKGRLMSYARHLVAAGVSSEVETVVRKGQFDDFYRTLRLPGATYEDLGKQIKNITSQLSEYGALGIVVLAPAEVRFRISVLMRMLKVYGTVVSPDEIGLDRTVVFSSFFAIAEEK